MTDEAVIARLREALAEARAALDPFARVGAILKPLDLDPKTPLWEVMPRAWPTLGDAERARAALEPRAAS